MSKKMDKIQTMTSKQKISDGTGLHFTKMTGAGNDFLIFDARAAEFPDFDRALLAKSLCRRSLSIGADGLVFLEKTKTPQMAFKWDFYNADGSTAEMCGNAARCVARFAFEKKIADHEATFETLAGPIRTRVMQNGLVEVEMPQPKMIQANIEIPVGENIKIKVDYLMAGVPHVVKLNDDWDPEYLNDMGAYIRKLSFFAKTNGTNVTFYELDGENAIQAATYERGVEAVTMACGTGAVAAAYVAVIGGMKSPVEVRVPGGALRVDVDRDGRQARLTGEARFICEGEVNPEALL